MERGLVRTRFCASNTYKMVFSPFSRLEKGGGGEEVHKIWVKWYKKGLSSVRNIMMTMGAKQHIFIDTKQEIQN